jgi:hypothetical protein
LAAGQTSRRILLLAQALQPTAAFVKSKQQATRFVAGHPGVMFAAPADGNVDPPPRRTGSGAAVNPDAVERCRAWHSGADLRRHERLANADLRAIA